MDWKEWKGRKIFVRTKSGKVYSGIVEDIDDKTPPLVWFQIIDKFGNIVTIVHSEILEIKEERGDEVSKV